MEANKILSASILDLLFENRNKEYGAYELRKTYQKRITKAVLITAGIVLLIVSSLLARSSKSENRNRIMTTAVELSNIKDEKEPELPKPIKQEVREQVRTEQFTRIEIKPDKDVRQEPPTQDDLKIADIGGEKHDGINPDDVVHPDEMESKAVIEKRKDIEPEILMFVEIDAKFSGNWQRFLERNLNPEVPVSNGAPAGNYTIEIQFVVDKEGNVSDIKPLTNLGYGMEQEAVRVLKRATKWDPAIQNGRKVKAYRRQRITFQVLGE